MRVPPEEKKREEKKYQIFVGLSWYVQTTSKGERRNTSRHLPKIFDPDSALYTTNIKLWGEGRGETRYLFAKPSGKRREGREEKGAAKAAAADGKGRKEEEESASVVPPPFLSK